MVHGRPTLSAVFLRVHVVEQSYLNWGDDAREEKNESDEEVPVQFTDILRIEQISVLDVRPLLTGPTLDQFFSFGAFVVTNPNAKGHQILSLFIQILGTLAQSLATLRLQLLLL